MFSVQAEILDGRLSEFLSQGAGLLTTSQLPLSLIAISTFEGLKPFIQDPGDPTQPRPLTH